jgi:hypothetical protein
MSPGTRHKLLPRISPDMEDKISSIQIGSKVAVVLFRGPDFASGWGEQPTIYEETVSKLDIPFNVASLIVYPKAVGSPLGVWLTDRRYYNEQNVHAFFPFPEEEDLIEYGWGFMGNVNMDENANGIYAQGLGASPYKNSIQVVLYDQRNWQGTSLTLPGAAGWPSVGLSLGDYDWSDRAVSMRIRWTGPKLGLGPPPASVKAEAPPISSEINIDGRWQSSIGLIYDISQSGAQFKWTVIRSTELGAGELQGMNLKAFWTDGRSTFSAQGKIIQVDAQNKATRIEWDNGVIFYR